MEKQTVKRIMTTIERRVEAEELVDVAVPEYTCDSCGATAIAKVNTVALRAFQGGYVASSWQCPEGWLIGSIGGQTDRVHYCPRCFASMRRHRDLVAIVAEQRCLREATASRGACGFCFLCRVRYIVESGRKQPWADWDQDDADAEMQPFPGGGTEGKR